MSAFLASFSALFIGLQGQAYGAVETTGDIELFMYPGDSYSWEVVLPSISHAELTIKYGLWNSPNLPMDISVNGVFVAQVIAETGYSSPGPYYDTFDVTSLLVTGENTVEVQALTGGQAVLGRLDLDYQSGNSIPDADGDGYDSDNDCDDTNPFAWDSSAAESCDGYDNNCDGVVDEGLASTYYLDADGDGYGDPGTTTQSCVHPSGYSDNPLDCDDANAWAWNTGAPESCDGYDNNCDGQADEGLSSLYYLDADGDGYGDPLTEVETCELMDGYVSDYTDCDDANPWAWDFDAAESCDGYDNNCDGQADEEISQNFYADADGDGFGDLLNHVFGCEQPEGYTAEHGDCDDADAAAYPGAAPSEDLPELCRRDADGDGYGEESPLSAAVTPGTDCDDSDSAVSPGAPEAWYDGVDQDCDGNDDDQDGDGFAYGVDCDDEDVSIYPGSEGLEMDCSPTPDVTESEEVPEEETDGDSYKYPGLACSSSAAPSSGVWGMLALLGLAARRRSRL